MPQGSCITVLSAADFDRHAQALLQRTYPGRCVYHPQTCNSCVKDVSDVATSRFDNVMEWSLDGVRKGKAAYAYCVAHHKCCRLGNVAHVASTIMTVEAAGPTCEPFSMAGKRKKAS